MQPLKILHTADWHLGSFPCPASRDKVNARFADICSYIEFLISEAKSRQPDIIIIAGDVFHQAKTWSDRGLQETNTIIKYISELSDTAPVCILRGTSNHDGRTHFDLLHTALSGNKNVHIIDEPCVKNINNLAAIAFVPIFNKNLYRAEAAETLDKEAENNYFCDKVRDAVLDLKPQADATSLPTILVTHYTVLGAKLPHNKTSIFANQEVVIDPVTLIQADYWLSCLGHVHKPQQLEVCPTAFYAGSLCALTFNDEYDPHGFYMHTINGKNDIQSEFIEVPCRKFHTIYLNDDQLNDIIDKDYNVEGYITAPVQNDIIRVIYNCMDTTNKKLNKALLEKALYDSTGAFYVQEIIPSDIIITIDRTAMQSTASVADNLRLFLENEKNENGSITDAQINDCIQLAEPIIEKLSANQNGTRSVGVFTPIEIEVKNYRSYKHAVINYENVRFCVINGDNGAGKSSLFMDAMLDAIFEEPREGEITGWINNDVSCRSGSIKLTFSIGDNIYKITRTRQKSGKATLNLAQFTTDENGDENWVDMSEEKLKDTQEAINKLVGMDALTLKSCGLIMQDAYGLFLQADKTTRIDILSNIIGLGIYSDLSDNVSEFDKVCQREMNKITDEETEIITHMKNGEEISRNLQDAYNAEKQYENDLKEYGKTLIANTKKREEIIKSVETHNRLCDEIDEINLRIEDNNKIVDEQTAIMRDANAVVALKNDLDAKTRRYNELTALAQSMAAKADKISALINERTKLGEELTVCSNAASDADAKIETITAEKHKLELEMANIDDMKAKAALYEKTKKEIADAEAILAQTAELEKQLGEYTAQLAEIKHLFENRKTEYDTQIAVLDRKIAIMTESGCPITDNAPCKFLADAQKARSEKETLTKDFNAAINEYNQKAPALEAEISRLTNQIQQMSTGLPDLKLKKQELSVYENCAFKTAGLAEMQKTLAVYEQQIKDFAAAKSENEAKKQTLINSYNAVTEQISSLTLEIADRDKVNAEIAAIGDLNELRSRIAANEAVAEAAQKRINEIQTEIQSLTDKRMDKFQERHMLNINMTEIQELNAGILACQTQQELLTRNIAENGKLIGQLEQDMTAYNNDIRRLDQLKFLKNKTAYMTSNAGWLKKAFSRNGIPHNIIRSIIPVLETTASNILSQMSGGAMSIMLQTEKMLTTKREIVTLDIIVCDTAAGDLPYLSKSGGERVKAALSVVLALAEIKSSESGTQLGFLFIDEPPFLDSNGIEAYCDALVAIQNRYSNLKIIAITHDPEMKSRFGQSIDITKTPTGIEIVANL